MWTVLFGEHDAAAAAASKEPLELLDDEQENQQPSPRNRHTHAAASGSNSGATVTATGPHGKLRLSTASTAASSPPLSPTSAADAVRFSSESAATIRGSESSLLAPSPPGSSHGVRRASGSAANALPPSSTSSRRGSRSQVVDDDDAQQTPMAMLLRRLNQLMMKVGEHEFEKKTLVDGMEKDRERLTRQIAALQRELEDVKDQNVQLQYKLEYTTEPMLMEQLQDVTDMRDALTSVKVQLEREIGEKDKALAESHAALAAKTQEFTQLSHELHELECERDDLEQRLADAAKLADAQASAAFEAQLAAKDAELAALNERCAALGTELQQREQQIEELHSQREVTAQQHRDEVARLSDELAAFTVQLSESESAKQREAERVAALSVCEQELRSRVAELEQQANKSESVVAELNHELSDYKEDCLQLWKANEDLKQQLALASAETMLRDAEMRETALSGQTALLDKVNDLEYQLQVMHEQLDEKTQEIVKLQADAALTAAVSKPAPVAPVDQQAWKGAAIRVLTDQVVAAQRELSDAMDLNLHLNNRNTWLEEQYKQLTAVSAAADSAAATVRTLEATVAQLTAQCSELQYANADLERARSDTQEQLAQRTHEWEALSNEVAGLRSSSHAMAQELQQAQSSATSIAASSSDELSKAQHKLRALQTELESARSAQQDAASLAERLRISEKELRAANEALAQELRDAQSASALAQERANAQSELELMVSTLRDDKSALQRELESVQTAYNEATYYAEQFRSTEHELEAQRAAHDKLVSELRTAQDALAAAEQQRADLAQQLADVQTRAREAQTQYERAQAQCEAQRLDLAALEHQLKNLQAFSQETADEAESKYEEAMLDVEALRQALDAKDSECAQLQRSVDDARHAAQRVTALESDLERARLESSDFTAQVQHLRGVEQQLTARLAQANEQLATETAAATAERVALEHEVAALRQQQSEWESRLRDAEAAQRELQRENDEVAALHDADRAKLAQLEHQLVGASADAAKLHAQVESLTKKNLALRSEVESVREETELQSEASQSLVESLKAAQSELARALQAKDAELAMRSQQSQSEVQHLQALAARLQDENSRLVPELEQLRGDVEQLRVTERECTAANSSLATELEQHRHELARLQHALEADASRAHTAEEQLAHTSAANRELESALERSKQFCEDLSTRCDELQAYAKQFQEDSQSEVRRLTLANEALQQEIDKFAAHRLREASAEEELHLHIAELQAENNVLAARAHRLTQQLSQFTDVPEEDRLADNHSQTPDLWELLSSGMEQLKADLELASKYAASIDANGLEVVDGGDEPLAIAS